MEKLCECGCGNPAPISPVNHERWNYIKGQPRRFIRGHATKGKKFSCEIAKRISDANQKTRFKKGHKSFTDGKNLLGLQAGRTHWNWRGGITPEVSRLRGTQKYIDWRNTVFRRDNYTCQICRKGGKYVEADHYPNLFSDLFKKKDWKRMWDINNGRTLCRKCHDKTKWKRKGFSQDMLG